MFVYVCLDKNHSSKSTYQLYDNLKVNLVIIYLVNISVIWKHIFIDIVGIV